MALRVKVEAVVVAVVFAMAVAQGAYSPASAKVVAVSTLRHSLSPLSKLIESGAWRAYLSLPVIILYNNLRVALVNILLGVTILAPLAIVWFNGYIIGSVATYGNNTLRNIVLMVPHGVVELAAILYSAALGLRVGVEGIKRLLGRRSNLFSEFKYALSQFRYVFLLLLIAAFIESFITPLVYLIYRFLTGS